MDTAFFHTEIFALGGLLLAGLAVGRLTKRFGVPRVAGYLIAGLLLGPSFLELVPGEVNETLHWAKVLAVGVIALFIGSKLTLDRLDGLIESVTWISVAQITGAFVVVWATLVYLLHVDQATALVLGAMAGSTAPASPVAVIKETGSRGPLTTTLMGVAGLSDALTITLFNVVILVAAALVGGTLGVATAISGGLELALSLVVGGAAGGLSYYMLRHLPEKTERIIFFTAGIFLVGFAAEAFHFSALLALMIVGIVVANLNTDNDREALAIFDEFEAPFLVLFFALAGANLHVDVLLSNWMLAVVYIVARGIGKVGGVFAGGWLVGSPDVIRRYLGFAMFSKAGLTVALLLVVEAQLAELAALIVAIELSAITVCEIIGPIGTKYALTQAGETKKQRRERLAQVPDEAASNV